MASGKASAGAIVDAVDALPRVKGRRALLRTVAQCAAGAESYLEWHAAEKVFVGKPFDRFIKQYRVVVHGRNYRLDMYDQVTRVAVEVDGAKFHAGTDLWQRDLRRDADLASVGIQTVRFSYRDLHERPQWCRDRLRDILASRKPAA
ncbi:endonuclease domain-containing protein [Demequina aurantiaca]|uniref:endonuclease domain-containing protein n=1 Tax=Demequina aurantiaca TaxID=676200 RepID=UPI003D35458F